MELSQINDVPQIISLPISEDANTVQSDKLADASEDDRDVSSTNERASDSVKIDSNEIDESEMDDNAVLERSDASEPFIDNNALEIIARASVTESSDQADGKY